MASGTSENDLRTFRDFLMQYNLVIEQCFSSCVVDFTSKALSNKEETCNRNCLDKYLKMTQRISMRFQEYQLLQAEAQGATIPPSALQQNQ
ncbi:tim10/DDP family zinc finger domain-containing protein [Ditylenchus destructor]|uniref:Mitochondrial import inner membrane translocase subunit n=1 Tax=Ditylenchus destructor TaxID=166010 RepID=A0AAD4RAY4_9BILA|nr:tim10/DDP family zinc finger domain-containing protein [Ditylenchus destructor]